PGVLSRGGAHLSPPDCLGYDRENNRKKRRTRAVLIDSKQKKWFVAFLLLSAAAFAAWRQVNRTIPGGLRGGDTVGLWFGSLGSLLMIYSGLLAAHRKVPSWWWLGARKTWLRGHVWMGLLSVVLIL